MHPTMGGMGAEGRAQMGREKKPKATRRQTVGWPKEGRGGDRTERCGRSEMRIALANGGDVLNGRERGTSREVKVR